MIREDIAGNRAIGVYRGIVKKHLSHGRCKIFIDSIYPAEFAEDPDMLPSAEPATPLFAGTNEGNGCFSYPNLSSIVWCFFENNDVNFPVYFAATLGGEDAYGQYDIIKSSILKFNGDDVLSDDISKKHLITSGKTHIKWFESGKISAIVEDPIRTQCSVSYADYDAADNNISVAISNEISNYNISAIDRLQLSNIDCQFVLDNDASCHGELSTSTHWYDIIDINLSDEQYAAKGTVSTDNRNIMNNDGVLDIGTISTYNISEQDQKNSILKSQYSYVDNGWKNTVPGILDEHILNTTKRTLNDAKQSIIDDTVMSAYTYRHLDISANSKLNNRLYNNQKYIDGTLKQTINLTTDLSNNIEICQPGAIALCSDIDKNILSADLNKGSSYTEKTHNTAIFGITTDAETTLNTLSDTSLIDTEAGIINVAKLDNKISMSADGKIQEKTLKDLQLNNQKTGISTRTKSFGTTEFDVDGNHLNESKFYLFKNANGSVIEVDNDSKFLMTSKDEAATLHNVIGLKKISGSPIIDAKYTNAVNMYTSTANILVVDNIVKKECVNNMNANTGLTEIRITSKLSGMHCTITMSAEGKMTITTTDDLTVTTTNTVNINTLIATVNASKLTTLTTPTFTVNGNTTMNGTLHVTGLVTGDTDVVSRISLNSHTHPVPPHCPSAGMTAPGI